MLEKLLDLERGLFFLINSSHTPFLDRVMWLYSGFYIWIPFIVFFCFMLIYKKTWKEWLPVLGFILLVSTLCIIFSSLITKPLFARPRPIFHPSFMEDVRTLYESILEQYGFVSGHSAVTFGIAMFTSLLYRNSIYTCVVFTWSLLMAYSRIYLGVHFISDIVAGGLSGVIIGYLIFLLYNHLRKSKIKEGENPHPVYPPIRGKVIGLSLAGYIILFSLACIFG